MCMKSIVVRVVSKYPWFTMKLYTPKSRDPNTFHSDDHTCGTVSISVCGIAKSSLESQIVDIMENNPGAGRYNVIAALKSKEMEQASESDSTIISSINLKKVGRIVSNVQQDRRNLGSLQSRIETGDLSFFPESQARSTLIVSTWPNFPHLNLIGFSHPKFLSMLPSVDELFIDGTFAITPAQFAETVTVYGFSSARNRYFPLGIFLASGKVTDVYCQIFQTLKRSCSAGNVNKNFSPTYCHSDFEDAILLAWKECFPSAVVVGCFFHLKQAWTNHLKDVLKVPFPMLQRLIINEKGGPATALLDILALIPHEDIMTKGKQFIDSCMIAEFESWGSLGVLFWRYFESNWMLHPHRQPKLWSFYHLMDPQGNLRTRSRTNNVLERLHRTLKQRCGVHSSLEKFVRTIQSWFIEKINFLDEEPPECTALPDYALLTSLYNQYNRDGSIPKNTARDVTTAARAPVIPISLEQVTERLENVAKESALLRKQRNTILKQRTASAVAGARSKVKEEAAEIKRKFKNHPPPPAHGVGVPKEVSGLIRFSFPSSLGFFPYPNP